MDTGPLVAAASVTDRAHALAAELIARIGRGLVLPLPVIAEADYMIRKRVGLRSARRLLSAIADEQHEVAPITSGLMRRAVEFDRRYADLGLGITDASVMAVAEHHRLPILTFDFADFRATAPAEGEWRLVVSEELLEREIGRAPG